MPDEDEVADLLAQRDVLLARRERWFATASAILQTSQNVTARNHHRYKGHYDRLSKIQQEFDGCMEEILTLNIQLPHGEEVDVDAPEKAFTEVVETAQMNFLAYNNQENAPAADQRAKPHISLPKLSIPRFSGDLEGWVSFISMFNATIHENASLSGAEKFSYLLSLLKEEPLKLVNTLQPLTDDNYEMAYQLLTSRYQTEKRHIFHHFQGLLDLPAVRDNSDLPTFLTSLQQHLHALKALKYDDTTFAPLLVTVLYGKLSQYHRRRLDDSREDPKKYPELKEIIRYLEDDCSLLQDTPFLQSYKKKSPKGSTSNAFIASSQQSSNVKSGNGSRVKQKSKSASTAYADGNRRGESPINKSTTSPQSSKPQHNEPRRWSPTRICIWCDQKSDHTAFRCEAFLNRSIAERRLLVAAKKRCTNCLGPCAESCISEKRCFKCQGKHHSLLHEEASPSTPASSAPEKPVAQSSVCTGNSEPASSSPLINVLPTARVLVSAPNTKVQLYIRCVLDSGATDSYLTSNCARKLNLRPIKTATSVTGLGQNCVPVDGVVKLNIHDRNNDVLFDSHPVFVVNRITGLVPSVPVCSRVRAATADLQLADPTYDQPGNVDALIGADLFPQILAGETISLGPSEPRGIPTAFGVVLMGPARCQPVRQPSAAAVTLLAHTQLSEQIERFWKLEEVPAVKRLSADEEAAEKLYTETTVKQSNDRYIVRLPFRPNHPPLGNSRWRAEKQLFDLEKRFDKDPALHTNYCKYMHDYLGNKYMQPTKPPDEKRQHYYLPHHGVFRDSSTTKLRVVFNASAPTSTGVSLNDVLLPGAPLQLDIRDVLLNFRRHPVVFTADIKQMFLQIDLHPEDRQFQLILWRWNKNEPIQVFELGTVTFGITSSPFLSNRTIKQLARDYGHLYPRAAAVLLESVYVDDILGGADDEESARLLLQELIDLLSLGGFTPRKFTSNRPSILSQFPVEDLEPPKMDDPENPRYSVLGLDWLPQKDSFTYRILPRQHERTKRGVLSQVSSVYDPNGYIAPVTFSLKSFMQIIWTRRIDWDEELHTDLIQQWNKFLEDLPSLKQIQIPRLLGIPGATKQIHGFCDASDAGFSATLYLRSAPADGSPAETSLIMAKTRVAPLKRVNTPRLELCGATLLANLLMAFLPQLEKLYSAEKVFCWTDSSNVLAWIQTPSYQLKTFVGNRVAVIQELPADVIWRHISTIHNPADCASRGLSPSALIDHPLWWHGPAWLSGPSETWPESLPARIDETRLELKSAAPVLVANRAPNLDLSLDFSSWDKGIKVASWVLRFFTNLSQRVVARAPRRTQTIAADQVLKEEPLTSLERQRARLCLISLVQRQSFAADIAHLKAGQVCSTPIQRLAPFFDKHGLIRVGGRLTNARIPTDVKHPILLPSNHPLVALLVKHYHESCLHAGPQLTHAHLSRRFWVHAGRRLIRTCVHRCIPCFRARPRNANPLMGDLPASRVNVNPAFTKASCDCAGPFKVKIHQLRSARVVSVYICIFVCQATKAVHIEVVHDMTTLAFLAAVDRFAARRGCPTDIASDCGSNFVGAANTLSKFLDSKDPELRQYAEEHNIVFHFNPPAAPHQGGLWESAVKSFKSHLARTMANHVLILEEFQTLCAKIEAMLNSRPLTPLSSDPNDFMPLTPGHFLIGRPMVAPPEVFYADEDIPRLHRWHLVSALFQQIWRRWQIEYVHLFQPRKKWIKDAPALKVNDLVLVHDPDLPPLKWKLARVIEVHPGRDQRVRVATIKTASGEFKRPVHKLFPLPVDH